MEKLEALNRATQLAIENAELAAEIERLRAEIAELTKWIEEQRPGYSAVLKARVS